MSKRSIIITLSLIVIAIATTRYLFPKVEYKTIEIIKEVEKTVLVKDTKTITKIEETPDGKKTTTIEVIDKSKEITDKSKQSETSSTQTTIKHDWMISIGANLRYDNKAVDYSLNVQRRILGPAFVGINISTSKSIGINLGIEF